MTGLGWPLPRGLSPTLATSFVLIIRARRNFVKARLDYFPLAPLACHHGIGTDRRAARSIRLNRPVGISGFRYVGTSDSRGQGRTEIPESQAIETLESRAI